MVDHKECAVKWQKKWNEKKLFRTRDKSKKPKFYCLEMFPYPSAYGLHMGHVRNYSIGDTIARYKRMQGYNVLYPMGFDAFGLPAENAAIKHGIHPKEYTEKAIASIETSMKRIGLSYDWERKIATCHPEYYKWNQYFFLKFLEKGLAYKKKAPINWCPSCATVLANEQVTDGKCWRCENKVEVKELEQWFLKITHYAEELLKEIDTLDWPEKIKLMQRNWIGKSEGTEVQFKLADSDKSLSIYTTRIDTLFSVTFLVIAPEHPLVEELVKGTEKEKEVKDFVRKIVIEEKFTRAAEDKEKEGIFTGKYAINPATNEKISIWIANFVLMDYGTGIVMADAHDKRDFEFAKKYGIPLKRVLKPKEGPDPEQPIEGYGIIYNSGQFDGLTSEEAIPKIQKWLEEKGAGKRTVNYKIRDWLISRQRYWGTPIPIIYCKACGMIKVPEEDLPVKLPENVQFTGKGNPLLSSETFLNVKCPQCGGQATRETDTMDTFVDSSWYFLRYISPKDKKFAFDKTKVKYWLPVDQYIGGAEHAVMHLLYARFFAKVLRDLGYVEFGEPFKNLFNQGIVHKEGQRMSKSHGNIVSQEEVEEKYGIDTARLFMLFVASPDKDIEWSDEGAQGSFRFVNKLFMLYDKPKDEKISKAVESKINALVKKITELLNGFELNKAIIELMSFADYLDGKEKVPVKVLETYTLLLAPFIPHIAEELWEKLGNKPFACVRKWPKFKAGKIKPKIEYEEKFVDRVVEDINEVLKLIKIEKPNKITVIVADKWKTEFYNKLRKELEGTKNTGDIIKNLMHVPVLRKQGEFVVKLVPKFVQSPGDVPEILLGEKKELKVLHQAKETLAKKYGSEVFVLAEKESAEQKAKQAMPSKPAIVIG